MHRLQNSNKVDSKSDELSASAQFKLKSKKLSASILSKLDKGAREQDSIVNDCSPKLKSNKRGLNISPSTPVGLQRKSQSLLDRQQNVQVLTFDQDVEMFEFEDNVTSEQTVSDSVPVIDCAKLLTPSRKIIRALRRTDLDHNATADVQDKQPAQTGVTCTGTGADKASGNTKGT